jgi:1-acyl-sn-glycerol-3-phosphate acyltransferase
LFSRGFFFCSFTFFFFFFFFFCHFSRMTGFRGSTVSQLLATLWIMALLFAAFLLSFVVQVLMLPVLSMASSRTRRRYLNGARALIAHSVRLNPLWRVRLGTSDPAGLAAVSGGGVVLLANHTSNLDSMAIVTALAPLTQGFAPPCPMVFLAKGSLFSVPLGGWAMRLAGDVPVHFTSGKGGFETAKGSVHQAMTALTASLEARDAVVAFPEGERGWTTDGPLLPFRDGMFRLAGKTGARIVPIGISGAARAWPRGHILVDTSEIVVRVGIPIETEGKDVAGLVEATRAAIESLRQASN